MKVRNQYGETLEVKETVGNSVRVYEDYNNLYHCSKLFFNGNEITATI